MDGDKFSIGFQARLDEAWDDLPGLCKHCKFLTKFLSCGLREQEEDCCPLEYIECKECDYCCEIIRADGTKFEDCYFCELSGELIDNDSKACREFEGRKKKP